MPFCFEPVLFQFILMPHHGNSNWCWMKAKNRLPTTAYRQVSNTYKVGWEWLTIGCATKQCSKPLLPFEACVQPLDTWPSRNETKRQTVYCCAQLPFHSSCFIVERKWNFNLMHTVILSITPALLYYVPCSQK